jgi:AraC family transcriptional regulator
MCLRMATAARLPRVQYFGGDLRSFRTHSGLQLSEVDYGPRKWPRHTHGRAFFAFLLSGGYVENRDRHALAYRPFDLGFHPESTRHEDEICAADTRFFLIELDETWERRLREVNPAAAREPRLCSPDDARLAARLYRAYRGGDTRSGLFAEGLVLELLAGLLPGSETKRRPPPAWLAKVRDLLESEPPRRLSLEVLAKETGLHPVYLSRAFRNHTGRSVSQHVAASRIRFAARKLSEASLSLSLTQIALEAGFADQSHFTRSFRRDTGLTPAAFRSMKSGPGVSNHTSTRRKG